MYGVIKDVKISLEDKIESTVEKVNIVAAVNDRISLVEDRVVKIYSQFEQLDTEYELRMNKEIQRMITRNSKPAIPHGVSAAPMTLRIVVKLAPYDGKTAWTIYKTQFEMVAFANNWDTVTQAVPLVASLRGENYVVIQTVPAENITDYEALINEALINWHPC